jgi:dihydrofolate reductase
MPAAGLLGVAARPSVTSCDNEAVWLGADEFDEPAGVASARIVCVAGDDSAERRVSSQTLREWLPQRALAPFVSCVWVQRVEAGSDSYLHRTAPDGSVELVCQAGQPLKFGRRTYETFAGYWGVMPDPENNPIAGPLNTRPKYVASTTLTDPQWADTTVLSEDVAAAIGELKAKPADELQVHGSGSLVRWLFDNQLVDEITLLTYPVAIGQGTRLFPATGPDTALDLVDSRATPTGVTIQVYRPTGRPQYVTATPTPST